MIFEDEDFVISSDEEEHENAIELEYDEEDWDWDWDSDWDSDWDEVLEDMETTPYDHNALLQYISQVRNSFDFDVDTSLPSVLKIVGSPLCFTPIRLSRPDPGDIDYVNEAASLAIDGINLDMENKTSSKLAEVTKAVTVEAPYDLLFLTLAVKKVEEEAKAETIRAVVYHPVCEPWELHQWMFVKPDPAEA